MSMKIYLAAIAMWVLSAGPLYAQKSTYLKADVGFGRGAVRERFQNGLSRTWQPVSASRVAVGKGIQVKKFSVEIGFGYSRMGGRKVNGLSNRDMKNWVTYADAVGDNESGMLMRQYHYITMPLSIGYDVRLSKRWMLQPRMGVEGAYNFMTSVGAKVPGWAEYQGSGTMATDQKRLSAFGNGALHLHYRVTPSIELFGGPSYRHMLTNGARETLYVQPPYYQLRTTSATFDAGLKLQLNRTSPAPKVLQE